MMNDRDDYDQPRNRPEAVPPPPPTCPDCKLPFAPGYPASCICPVREFANAPLGEPYESARPTGAIGKCSQCERPRYPIVPNFPTTTVCVCPERPLPPVVPFDAEDELLPMSPEQLRRFADGPLGEEYAPYHVRPDDDATPPNAPVVPAMTADELPSPMTPPSIPRAPELTLRGNDFAASYLLEIWAAVQEGDGTLAMGWLIGLLNNTNTARLADPEHVAPTRATAEAMRTYYVENNPQEPDARPAPWNHNYAKGGE